MKRDYRFGPRSWVLLLLIIILTFAMLYFLKQLQSVDLFIKKNQVNQQMNTQQLESRVKTLEEVVILQSKIILELDELQPSPEKSQKVTEPKKTSSSVDSSLSMWPATVVSLMQVLKGVVNPVKVLLPY